MSNEKQLKEWEELGFGKIKRVEYKKLPIDTRYFDEEFKFEMLEKISEKHDLDDVLDGLKYKGADLLRRLYTLRKKYEDLKNRFGRFERIFHPYNIHV